MLRAPEPDDLDFLYQLENDPELWAHTDVLPMPVSRQALRAYLAQAGAGLAEAGQLRLIIECEGQAAGTLDLYDYSARHRRAGVGVAVARSWRRRGLAEAALRALLPYAAGPLGLHQLYCTVAAGNGASRRLFKKLGFRVVGTRREWLRAGNDAAGWENAIEMQLLLQN